LSRILNETINVQAKLSKKIKFTIYEVAKTSTHHTFPPVQLYF